MGMLVWTRRIVLGALALVSAALAVGLAYEQGSRWSATRSYPPVGELIEVDGRRSHLQCTGEGEPTVVLESGWSVGGSMDWVKVQPAISRLTRVCSYDRAGVLWSERRRGPRDGARIATELHALLEAASELPPYVMVGHSLGGALMRVFASRFEDEVVGFVFVDSSHPDQDERVPPFLRASLPRLPSPFMMKLRSATGLYRRRASSGSYGLPTEISEVVDRFGPKSMTALADEMAAMDEILGQAGETGTLADYPLVVLTAANHATSGMSQAGMVAYQDTLLALHAELAGLSTNADHRTIQHAHHYIQLVAPDAVVAAVQDVLAAVRDGTRLVPGGGTR